MDTMGNDVDDDDNYNDDDYDDDSEDLISLYVIVDDDVYEHGYEYSICLLEIDNNESIISIVSTTFIDINDLLNTYIPIDNVTLLYLYSFMLSSTITIMILNHLIYEYHHYHYYQ